MPADVIDLESAPLDPAELAVTCELVVCSLASLLMLTDRHPSGLAVCEMLAAVPSTPDGLEALLDSTDGSLFARTIRAAFALRFKRCQPAVADGLSRLVFMPPERRALVTAAIRGVYLGHNTARY